MNKSLNKNTKKEKEKEKEKESELDITLNKESENVLENKSDIDFSNFLHNYITNESENENESGSGSGSDNSLISNDENDEGEGQTNRLRLQNFCYSSDSSSSSDYLPRYSTLTLRNHNYIPPVYVGPIDIEVYRVIYSCLNSRFPEEICEIITDYLSLSVFV